ncbi:hypothetical protein C8F04DRAFT_1288167 [Mycena alexandri]|uniref:Uncharacterized protein n=1 Tax=Mycena alexandri TaxID=1745969 RepID=A0AAD6SNJ9_9AGAR|nr:hypothetical protein C8F04DRAFT_1288167 [Mycena alexandri]
MSIPSTPTISTPSDLTPSPEPRPILLPAIFTPRRPQNSHAPSRPTTPKTYVPDDMAPNKSTELFRGNGTAEKAHTWLRTLEQTWKWDAEDKEKLYRFEKGLHPGSQAEEWWEVLDAKEKAGWKVLMAAFEKKWAKPKASRRGQDIVIQELMANSLDHGDLGKYVKDEDGTSVLSHVAWAETARNLLGELPGGDSAMMLKSAPSPKLIGRSVRDQQWRDRTSHSTTSPKTKADVKHKPHARSAPDGTSRPQHLKLKSLDPLSALNSARVKP